MWLVIGLYCLSGFTSLAYEVLWSRMLSMQFGVSIFGVVLTVAAFMIGLGLGSLAGIGLAKRYQKPLALFALLEIAIALYALLLPTLLHQTGGWLETISSHLTLLQWYLLQAAETLCLLVIPAYAMGLGFALVLKLAEGSRLSLSKLYGLNTTGGVLGALFPLWSLPALGWIDSVRIVAALGIAIGVAALLLSRFIPIRNVAGQLTTEKLSRPPLAALLVYAGIGAGSIMLEVGWVRLYGMIMLRTEYVLGVILAVFLLGIALGSLLLPRVHKYWLSVFLPFVVGAGVLLGLWFLPVASVWVEHSRFQSFFGAMYSQALMVGLFTLPVTLALGAWLPLLADRYAGSDASGVWLYGANCLGGGVGAVVACLVFIPLFGSAAMVAIAGLAITALGLSWVKSRLVWPAFATLALLAWPLRSMPPVHDLLPEIEANSQDLSIYEDAISLTHVVRQKDGQRILLSDLQRMDASSDPSAVEIQMDQARLALLLHPAPHSVLFLGLGTGISLAGSKPYPELNRSAVELSQGAILAAKNWFAPVNGNITDQTLIQRDDARHYLSSTQLGFDVIIGDLFHPDLAGMGSLLSVQQFQRARNHLNTDGVFVQWLALNQFDTESLAVVLRSFKRVFPDAQLFMDGMHLALVGPRHKLAVAEVMRANLQRMSIESQSLATGGEGMWTWLGRYWGPIPESIGPVQDEWLPYIEYNLPRARYDGNVNLPALMQWLLQRHPDADSAMKLLEIDARDKGAFGRAYVSTELMVRAWIASIKGEAAKAGNLNWVAYQASPQDRWIANALADNMMQSLAQARGHGFSDREALQRILKICPNHVGAIRALWHLEQGAGNMQGAALYRLRLQALSPLDSEVTR
ncbi:MAG: hypothetical protein WC216_02085 [Gallionella sp.]